MLILANGANILVTMTSIQGVESSDRLADVLLNIVTANTAFVFLGVFILWISIFSFFKPYEATHVIVFTSFCFGVMWNINALGVSVVANILLISIIIDIIVIYLFWQNIRSEFERIHTSIQDYGYKGAFRRGFEK